MGKKIIIFSVFILLLTVVGSFKSEQCFATEKVVGLTHQTMNSIFGGACVLHCKGYNICTDANDCANYDEDQEACNAATETDGTGITAWACTGVETTSCTPSNSQVCRNYKHCEWRGGVHGCGASAVYYDHLNADSNCTPQ